ncbi:MAG TPA: hypothetical protein VIG97_09390 [Luteimonas sp.]
MRRIIALLVVMTLVAGCADHRERHDANCRDIGELPAGNLFLFGEMHGSVEAPALVAAMACHLSFSEDVAIGLEIPTDEQPRIDQYLASAGTKSDEARLVATTFWRNGNDGRTSGAMLDLFRELRALKAGGRSVEVFAFDAEVAGSEDRDKAMASSIRRYRSQHPSRTIVALMGNIHAMQEEFVAEDFTMAPAGQLLRDLSPISILIAYPKGTVWACMPDCGVHNVAPRNPNHGPSGFREGASMTGYSHTYFLDSITASPPAASGVQ